MDGQQRLNTNNQGDYSVIYCTIIIFFVCEVLGSEVGQDRQDAEVSMDVQG